MNDLDAITGRLTTMAVPLRGTEQEQLIVDAINALNDASTRVRQAEDARAGTVRDHAKAIKLLTEERDTLVGCAAAYEEELKDLRELLSGTLADLTTINRRVAEQTKQIDAATAELHRIAAAHAKALEIAYGLFNVTLDILGQLREWHTEGMGRYADLDKRIIDWYARINKQLEEA